MIRPVWMMLSIVDGQQVKVLGAHAGTRDEAIGIARKRVVRGTPVTVVNLVSEKLGDDLTRWFTICGMPSEEITEALKSINKTIIETTVRE